MPAVTWFMADAQGCMVPNPPITAAAVDNPAATVDTSTFTANAATATVQHHQRFLQHAIQCESCNAPMRDCGLQCSHSLQKAWCHHNGQCPTSSHGISHMHCPSLCTQGSSHVPSSPKGLMVLLRESVTLAACQSASTHCAM